MNLNQWPNGFLVGQARQPAHAGETGMACRAVVAWPPCSRGRFGAATVISW